MGQSDVDYDQGDAALKAATLASAQKLDGFTSTEAWAEGFTRRFEETAAN